MSLINEALQRARDEAERQESVRRGVPLPPAPRVSERSGWLIVAVLVLALTLSLTVVALVRVSEQRPGLAGQEPVPTGNRGLTEPEPSQRLVRHGDQANFGTEPSRSVTRDSTAVETLPQGGPDLHVENQPAPSDPTLTVPAGEDELTSLVRKSSDSASRDSSNDSASAPSGPEPEVFVRQADLGGGGTLDLGGIAWSQAGPYALLNGRVVGIGESVSGFIVRVIDPLEVVLEGQNRRIVLRLK